MREMRAEALTFGCLRRGWQAFRMMGVACRAAEVAEVRTSPAGCSCGWEAFHRTEAAFHVAEEACCSEAVNGEEACDSAEEAFHTKAKVVAVHKGRLEGNCEEEERHQIEDLREAPSSE